MLFFAATELTATQWGMCIIALGSLLALYLKLNKAEDVLAKRVAAILRAEAEEKKDAKVPQPFSVTKEKEFTTRDSFENHARLNREAHKEIEKASCDRDEKLEKEMRDTIRRIEEVVTGQGKNIERVAAQREENGAQLKVITSQLAEVLKEFGELSGTVNAWDRKGGKF